jgi:hypothetical protein
VVGCLGGLGTTPSPTSSYDDIINWTDWSVLDGLMRL